MSYLMNDAAAFAEEAAEGFVAANAALVRLVPGGAARRSATPEGEVAVVIGGGSGHYPAFAGRYLSRWVRPVGVRPRVGARQLVAD